VSWEPRTVWIAALVLTGLVAVFFLVQTRSVLAPELLALHVAIEADGAETAQLGPIEIEAGQGFRLHAVVEAKDWRGKEVFYTDAKALEVAGRRVDSTALRAWDRPERARLLWFTVEGAPPFSQVQSLEHLEELGYREIFRAEWPQTWSIPGRLDPTVENVLPGREGVARSERFGTQRFHVRLEVFGRESSFLPSSRLRSPGAAELLAAPAAFPAVAAVLPGPLEPLSRAFGLPQLELAPDAPEEVRAAIGARTDLGLAFSRLPLLAGWLKAMGVAWSDLRWEKIDLSGDVAWGGAGDVVRAGSKVAFTFRDEGQAERLDDRDLCLDFDRGATVRTLGEIFVGEGLIERAAAPAARRSAGGPEELEP
jgi:hypothetical protein